MLDRMREEMERVFEEFGPPWRRRGPREAEARLPSADLAETDEDLLLAVELPGVDKKGLSVEVLPDSVKIRGEVQEEKGEGISWHLSERVRGPFERTVPLPVEVQAGKAKAEFANGLLRIILPKTEAAKVTRPVKVQIE
jgi:HSP20 family protein